jgi:hypothetical protein
VKLYLCLNGVSHSFQRMWNCAQRFHHGETLSFSPLRVSCKKWNFADVALYLMCMKHSWNHYWDWPTGNTAHQVIRICPHKQPLTESWVIIWGPSWSIIITRRVQRTHTVSAPDPGPLGCEHLRVYMMLWHVSSAITYSMNNETTISYCI